MDATYRPLAATLDVLRGRGIDLTYLSSGGAVYGIPSSLPVRESNPAEPRTAYGIACRSAELLIARYAEMFDVSSLVLRCGNVYGPGQPGNRSQGLVAAALVACRDDREMRVFGDGTVVRDYVYIEDVVMAMRGLVGRRADAVRTLNIATGTGTSIREVIAIAEQASGIDLQVEFVPGRSCDVPEIVLDTSELRSLVDDPFTDVDDGIRRTWHDLVKNGDDRRRSMRA